MLKGNLRYFVKWDLFVGLTGVLSELGLCGGEDYELVRVSGILVVVLCWASSSVFGIV